jgi:hypothetical protein
VFQKQAMTKPEVVWTGGRMLDLDAPFKDVRGSSVILALKKSELLQAAVRRNPMLWRATRRMMTMRRS